MAETFNLLKRVRHFDTSPELSGYSGVRIYAGQDDDGNPIEYFAGDMTGKILEITNEWGTQAQADSICTRILGYRYQPYVATGTQVDPAAELGDSVTISGTYGGIFVRKSTYGRQITSDLEAPTYDEIEHEFQIRKPTDRQYARITRLIKSNLSITTNQISAEVQARENADRMLWSQFNVQEGLISAKVEKTGGDSSSFGWVLDESSWTLRSAGSDVFKATKNGVEITGKITATSGKIGGFDIASNYLSFNNQTWGGTNTSGIYIGPEGIQLGKNFKVDSNGNLHASSGTFTGAVQASKIQYGGENGTLSGAALTAGSVYGGSGGALRGGSITTYNTSGGINTSLGYADYANGVFGGWNRAPNIACENLDIEADTIVLNKSKLYKTMITFIDDFGRTVTRQVIGWS